MNQNNLISNQNKKVIKRIITPIITGFLFLIIAITIVTIIFSLPSKSPTVLNNAKDSYLRNYLASAFQSATLYKDTNSTYKGYKINPDNGKYCGEVIQPIINISDNGQRAAIFAESCYDKGKYFCADLESQNITPTAQFDWNYVKSGATTCNS